MQNTQTGLRVGDLVRVRDAVWRVRDLRRYRDCEAMDLAALEAARHGVGSTLLWPFDRPVRLAPRTRPRLVGLRSAVRTAARALVDRAPWGSLRAAAEADLDIHPYQLEPALAVVRGLASRVLLADEVGLGKTIQAGLIASELERAGELTHALILTPPGLRDQWADELDRRFSLRATVVDAAGLRRMTAALPRGANPWAWHRILVASIDFVKRPVVMRGLEALVWDLLVVDEAHLASGPSDRQAAVAGLAARARRVVLLTATPHDGDERAFDALCHLGRLGPPGEDPIVIFRRTRAGLGLQVPRATRLLFVRPTAAEARMHRLLERYTRAVWQEAGAREDRDAMLAVLVLRKRALSSAASLAVSAERRLACLDGPAGAAADQLTLPFDAGGETDAEDEEPGLVLSAPGLADRDRERRWLTVIAAAARRAAAHESKAARLARLLQRTNEPALVFTEYRDTLQRLAERLGRTNPLAVLHGGLGRAERAAAAAAFTRGDVRLLLATDAAGQGLNLHARCRWVVNFELPWSPARLEQRVGRVDRLGQRRGVHATHLVAADTAERLVLATLVARAARSRAALGEPAGWPLGPAAELDLAGRLLDAAPEAGLAGATRRPPATLAAHASPPARGSTRELRRPDLEEEATREAHRLEELRRLLRAPGLARATREPQLDAPLVALLGRRARRRARRAGASTRRLLLLYAASLEDTSGRAVDTMFLTVVANLTPSADEPRRPGELAAALIAQAAPTIADLARVELGARAEAVARRHSQAVATWLRRERRLRAGIGRSLAERLVVQPGLFDRRALRRAEAGRRGDEASLDAIERRLATLAARGQLEMGALQLISALELATPGLGA